MSEGQTAPEITVVNLAPSYDAFGMVMEFLAESDVFSTFEVGALAKVVMRQLADGHNLAGIQDDRLVGYAGWLHTTEATGEEWMENRAILQPLKPEDGDAVALTVFGSAEQSLTPRLIRGARELNKGKRVFFKRGYDAVVRSGRKSSVLNVSAKP